MTALPGTTPPSIPTLLAAIGDVAHPDWRARSVGVYRLWRDGGFVVGALLAGARADAFGMVTAIWVLAVLTAASGLIVAARMYETQASSSQIGIETHSSQQGSEHRDWGWRAGTFASSRSAHSQV